jgi:hypothetical protein
MRVALANEVRAVIDELGPQLYEDFGKVCISDLSGFLTCLTVEISVANDTFFGSFLCSS